MIIQTKAFGRAGLIGNPSDGYFGKTISLILRNFAAEVTVYESPHLVIKPGHRDELEFDSRDALVDDVSLNGYYGGIRLIKAAIKVFSDYCREHGVKLDKRNFTIQYRTGIPVRVGLAGSSGIITATMRALMSFYGVKIPVDYLPNVVLQVETEELGIGAGLQDRVIQAFEGVVYMNFDEGIMKRQGYGHYEMLPPENLPPLFVAYEDNLSEGTEVTHNDLRSRWRRGYPEVIEAMATWASYAEQARDFILKGEGEKIGPLMDMNFDLRAQLCQISAGNHRLVETGRAIGAHVKFCGSGGAVIGQYDGDPERFDRLKEAYGALGAKVIRPAIEGPDKLETP
jgi:glucuronokinase